MTSQTAQTRKAEHAARYMGYDPKTGETRYAVPTHYHEGIPATSARLIAAAPALLEALRLAETNLMHAGRCKVYGQAEDRHCTCGINEVREQARAAIRLVEGEK